MSVRIERYNPALFSAWNSFIKEAKNGVFLFDRGYMEYHADRFQDHSLLFFNANELLAVLPASENNGVLTSHGGLTYGGMIMHKRASAAFVLSAFDELLDYLKLQGYATFVYKCIPVIYHQLPSNEDLYALFRHNASLYRRDISSVIEIAKRPTYTKGTKYNLSKARKQNLRVEKSNNFPLFMCIEEQILAKKYGVKPTHSAAEISSLAERFPENIKLFLVYKEEECLGGTIIFETSEVVHTQYIGLTDEGKEIGALDFVVDYLLQLYATHRYFSFGISTEKGGSYLNEGLIRNKESFGARAVVHDFYKLTL
ncbi:MAG: GNAT family N-acetyltransferase [Chitinophagaceae bacterium]|nr:MAG: GNAT family N-acetyltransferase [Chitinophagaceae bacterium]